MPLRPTAAAVLVVPAAWVACELARAEIGYGCPWCCSATRNGRAVG